MNELIENPLIEPGQVWEYTDHLGGASLLAVSQIVEDKIFSPEEDTIFYQLVSDGPGERRLSILQSQPRERFLKRKGSKLLPMRHNTQNPNVFEPL